MTSIQKIQESIKPLREALIAHPVYRKLQKTEDLRVFMQHHVFAVWDFMSLLKALQNNLTCVSTPWIPVGNASTRFLINEIVVGEESDVDELGNRISHFELYLKAMQQAGSDGNWIHQLVEKVKAGQTVRDALKAIEVPQSIADFVNFTFEVIESNKPHIQAAVFTFGREDLIPDMFVAMVEDLNNESGGQASIFKYYLERHIEVDGDHHSHLALQMTDELIGNDETKIQEALVAVQQGLRMRIKLWDGVLTDIESKSLILN